VGPGTQVTGKATNQALDALDLPKIQEQQLDAYLSGGIAAESPQSAEGRYIDSVPFATIATN
jgi:hypothetical protein